MSTKRFVTLIISNKPIKFSVETDSIRHLIDNQKVEINVKDSQFLINKELSRDYSRDNQPFTVLGAGSWESITILNWLKNLLNYVNYRPLYQKKE